ncbi:tetratricopeptide repeat-containing sensor histidine kinase [Chitinophaga solisilvae]|uniref:Sensor histidine kinase n=1 Tax=Chitinophaga solisilvae TaxID=1233460 RepID=A0A3S1B421_9BACT|nr:tetratricopeptide repeat protein [Chitinophaga solisilvae]NSL88757.1 sensor histidine kinase [Chitinophaga solisilvae]
MSKKLLLICCFLLTVRIAAACVREQERDSLLQVFRQQASDTGRIHTLFCIGVTYLPDQLKKADSVFRSALRLSRKIDYAKGVADFACNYMFVQELRGEYRQSLFMLDRAIEIYTALRDTGNLMRALNYSANKYLNMGNFPGAARHYLAALKLAEKCNDSVFSSAMNNSLGAVFNKLEDYRKGLQYAVKGYRLGSQINNSKRMSAALIIMGASVTGMKRYGEGETYYRRAITLAREVGDSFFVMKAMINLGSAYFDQRKHDQALQQYKTALAISEKFQMPDTYLYLGYGRSLFYHRNDRQALAYVDKSISMAKRMHAGLDLRWAYYVSSNMKAALGDYRGAFAMREKYEVLNDSLTGVASQSQVQQLEMQYLSEKKDRELTEKKLLLVQKDVQLQQKNMWIIIIMISVMILLAMAFFIWQRLKHRQHLQQQQLQTLEIEKTVQVLEAMIAGEERERTRLARDLHDNIGGLLSAVKMHFGALKYEHPTLQRDTGFNHAMVMLDDSIGEVRKTAHNLMPEVLNRMGLADALRLYCRNVSHSRKLQIFFYATDNIQRFKGNFELSVYRIIQELVNNIIKHAEATEAIVQLTQHEALLTIQVEDNGIGFQQHPESATGMGLNSLQSRIKALNGNLEIDASTGQGTTAYIEFNIAIMQLMEV